ncbi:hypothetical protein [Paracnuella aquatica]|uniref:hypothetical protein n=1 Tax=Paracnuella aquatica TaxID=2268757 RepID=UPI0019D481B2|nr:hypothetical protein [Paracnuella aquatica]
MAHFFYNVINRRVLAMLVLLFAVTMASCNRKIAFNTSTVVPAAEGFVKIKKDKNNNHAIDVSVKNLAEPRRLPVPQNVYVVWIESRDGIKKLGQLKTSSGLFSSTLRAQLETVSAYKPTRLFVTAEGTAETNYPGAQVVLTTDGF